MLDKPLHQPLHNESPNESSDQAGCFALCDDSDPTHSQSRSRLYTGFLGALTCHSAADLPQVMAALQAALQQGQLAVGLFSYELGAALHGCAPCVVADAAGAAATPMAEVLLFSQCRHLSAPQVDAWLLARCGGDSGSGSAPAGVARIEASVGESEFCAALARIHAYIEAGDTYQVNYTYRLRFDAFGGACALYRRLRERQPVPYGALISLPDGRAVLSLSPELFVRHRQGELTVRPMKGTAAASGEPQQDALRAAALRDDPKNRAENLMIVDLLRNDLGRIARLGSVRVQSLFDVTRYSNVLQMTSTVQAQLRADVDLGAIFAALYPCGSITGAPKHRTMQIIGELEPDPRGIYTGAIGWFDPPSVDATDATGATNKGGIGDFCLSVPIRTMLLQPPGTDGVRRGEMGVGAGIVFDSDSRDEYAECHLKADFLTGLRHDFHLIETMHASRSQGCRHLERHLQRLHASARYFGFGCDLAALRTRIAAACAAMPDGDAPQRLRLELGHDGHCTLHSAPLAAVNEPVRLLVAPDCADPSAITDATDLFLRHKTSVRVRYDAAWQAAEQCGAFDRLFFNANGELTEGGRCNVFVKRDGRWYTPPLASGLLPGVMRAVLLDDPAWAASERRLTRDDLRHAGQVLVCNALRGVLAATLVWE
jgi:para-aminobenzoate synthetase/4-amino-4-deoxychorismate lyase